MHPSDVDLEFPSRITNLKYWARSERIISKTLQLLNDLSVGYTCVRKLVKLEEVQFMLNNHTSEHFPFLGNAAAIPEMRCRSVFYTSLGRLLMVDLGEDEDLFHTFMLPLTGNDLHLKRELPVQILSSDLSNCNW